LGTVAEGVRIHGFWTEEEKWKHINELELLAAFLALQTFASDLSDMTILLKIDNTTGIAYINRYGGTQIQHLNNISRQTRQWCKRTNLYLYDTNIPSAEN